MCRNIKTLFNFDPPATDEEIRDASLQFARKLSGFTKPSHANGPAFNKAVDEFAVVARNLLDFIQAGPQPLNIAGRKTFHPLGEPFVVPDHRAQILHCPERADRPAVELGVIFISPYSGDHPERRGRNQQPRIQKSI